MTGAFLPLTFLLSRRIQHVLYKNPVTPCWVIDQDVGDGADQVAVLDNGTSAHE